jgi:antitoxin (DNA-binding transcriptional repressor) of toxin-antitoxin stability system
VTRAAQGEDILIAEDGKPVALLTRIPPKKVSPLGMFKGQIEMADDFDDPVPGAQAKAEAITLVTGDAALSTYGVSTLW